MVLTGLLAACGSSAAPATSPSAPVAPQVIGRIPPAVLAQGRRPGAQNWTVYHYDAGGSGAADPSARVSSLKKAWTSRPLTGQLYGEPLVLGSAAFVATEENWVYALSATSGKILWSRLLGPPVPASDLGCGDIAPYVGVTSTPVIDVRRTEIFLVADELVSGRPEHYLYGLRLSDGKTELRQSVDPPHADTPYMLQRASLVLDGSRVVFGFGGNYGDCGPYHGWVESLPVTGGRPYLFEVDSGGGEREGAVWMGGAAPIVTKTGDVYVAVGNGSVTSPSPYDHSDAVLELSPSLRLLSYFAPTDWYSQNAGDEDLGSAAPALLPNGLVLQAGKSETIYLLSRSHLGGIGGQLRERTDVCGNDFDGGVAFSGSTAYLPCDNGLMTVRTDAANRSLSVAWQSAGGVAGSPILVGGLLLVESGGHLYAVKPSNGSVEATYPVGSTATHFPTPSFGDGRVFAISSDRVLAFTERRTD